MTLFSFHRRTGWEPNERHTMNWFKRTHVTHINGRLAIYGYFPRKRYFLAVWR